MTSYCTTSSRAKSEPSCRNAVQFFQNRAKMLSRSASKLILVGHFWAPLMAKHLLPGHQSVVSAGDKVSATNPLPPGYTSLCLRIISSRLFHVENRVSNSISSQNTSQLPNPIHFPIPSFNCFWQTVHDSTHHQFLQPWLSHDIDG